MKNATGNGLALKTADTVPDMASGRFITYTSSFPPPRQTRESGFYSIVTSRRVEDESEARPDADVQASMLTHTLLAVGHDINNALVLLYGALDLLEARAGGSSMVDLTPARSAAVRIKDLNTQLMEISRRGLPSHDTPFAFVGTLRKIVDMCAINSNMLVVYDLEDGLWPILMDADVFSQIAQNLALNARQAMPDGGTLTITGRNRKNAWGVCSVTVRMEDQGCGICDEDIPRIFCPHFTTKEDGHGIGLSFIKRAIESCGGKIEFCSSVGYGTAFTLHFPAQPEEP